MALSALNMLNSKSAAWELAEASQAACSHEVGVFRSAFRAAHDRDVSFKYKLILNEMIDKEYDEIMIEMRGKIVKYVIDKRQAKGDPSSKKPDFTFSNPELKPDRAPASVKK
jgi:hypothetical protein